MKDDISFARNMQINMLPLKGIYNNLKVDFFYEPSEMLSGDIFDVFNIDRNLTGVYICDVVGHGVTASMLSIYVKQTMRSICRNYDSIGKIMSELHRTFIALNIESDKYFSIFFCIIDSRTMEMEYINAGHNCVPLIESSGKVEDLKLTGYPICNIFDTVEYESKKRRLKAKDRILFFTDGITEIKNKENEFLGDEKIRECFESSEDLSGIINLVNNFNGEEDDDIALLEITVI